MLMDREAMYSREAWAFSIDRSLAIAAHVRTLETQVAALITQTTSLQTQLTTTLRCNEVLEARDPEPQEGPAEAGNSCVAAALAEHDANTSRNGNNSNDSETGERRQMTTPRECSYIDFLKCQPMSFQGTEGVAGLTRWLEKMESVFQISNCTIAYVAYAMPWATLKRMITNKYCPRGEIQKLESEYWNLKVKGVDLLNYNHHFQELALVRYTNRSSHSGRNRSSHSGRNRSSDSAGTDIVTQAGTDLVTQAGTDLVTKTGTDLVTQAGTDLVTQAGTDLVTQAGTDLVTPAGTDLDHFSDNRYRPFF
nr:hypothetical protein [Tanacetum cinerariifolium]